MKKFRLIIQTNDKGKVRWEYIEARNIIEAARVVYDQFDIDPDLIIGIQESWGTHANQ